MSKPYGRNSDKSKHASRAKPKIAIPNAVLLDRRLWSGPKPSSFIVYALGVGHLALAPEPVPEYEKTALFKEKARASIENGHFAVEVPARVYEFYHLDESDYTAMASEKKPKTIEIIL
jgi:hypothetical protein